MARADASVAEKLRDGAYTGQPSFPETLIIPITAVSGAVSAAAGVETFRVPWPCYIIGVRGSLATAQASGSLLTIDVNADSNSIFSTRLTFDNTETTTTTATTPAVLTSNAVFVEDDDLITIDVDQIGNGTAAGLKVVLYVVRV